MGRSGGRTKSIKSSSSARGEVVRDPYSYTDENGQELETFKEFKKIIKQGGFRTWNWNISILFWKR